MIWQVIWAFLGSMGFALLFQIEKKHLLWASFGGLFSWAFYLLASRMISHTFYAVAEASMFAAVYSENVARFRKAPAILFNVPSVVPLIPGSLLYYAMDALVKGQWRIAFSYSSQTLQWMFGISVGNAIVLAFYKLIKKFGGQKSV